MIRAFRNFSIIMASLFLLLACDGPRDGLFDYVDIGMDGVASFNLQRANGEWGTPYEFTDPFNLGLTVSPGYTIWYTTNDAASTDDQSAWNASTVSTSAVIDTSCTIRMFATDGISFISQVQSIQFVKKEPFGTVMYVSPGGSNTNAGTDPDYPKQTIQGAIDDGAIVGGRTVRVRAGSYNEYFSIPDNVYVTGNFDAAWVKILNPSSETDKTKMTPSSPSAAIVFSGVVNRAGIDGMTIEPNTNSSTTVSITSNTGMITLKNMRIGSGSPSTGTTTALYIQDSSVVIENCFIACAGNSTPNSSGVVITNTVALPLSVWFKRGSIFAGNATQIRYGIQITGNGNLGYTNLFLDDLSITSGMVSPSGANFGISAGTYSSVMYKGIYFNNFSQNIFSINGAVVTAVY